uniref:Carboxylic ester hydrolase n=1 Tax=Psilocybe cubensis TaxID=181762 RepID=A0A8H8CFU5_PSICU
MRLLVLLSTLVSLSLYPFVGGSPVRRSTEPTVTLSYGGFQGKTSGNLVKFLGMPFAAPPVGNLRFAPPQPPIPFAGVKPATSFGAACFQQLPQGIFADLIAQGVILNFTTTPTEGPAGLTINVVAPATLTPGQKVPVVFWMYGGGFQFGDASVNPGDTLVARSIEVGEPIIFVSANYRINAFGFLGGKEVKEAGIGNAGLRDQRFAMQWIQENISLFGGDPTRVTIWGSSAGAISVGLHMVANNGDPQGLFHNAFMISGFPMALHDIEHQQPFFDQLVKDTGCTGSTDPIACLRAVPYDTLANAVNQSPGFFSFSSVQLSWPPTVDGQFITQDPQTSIQQGRYAKIPIIAGDCDDEGTVFSLTTLNITNDSEFIDYMKTNYFEDIASAEQLKAISIAYPQDVTQGSPFNTGASNALTPQFKRLAAIQGDLEFQAPRRFFLETASKTQPTYSYLYKRGKSVLLFGAQHGSDVNDWFGIGTSTDFVGTDAVVNFVNNGDPNTSNAPKGSNITHINWPLWSSDKENPPMFTFLDSPQPGGSPTTTITPDTYRTVGIQQLIDIYLKIGTA